MDSRNLSGRSSSSVSYGGRRRSDDNLDRFIPNRGAMDFDLANYMLTRSRRNVEKGSASAYQNMLAETFDMNRTRILSFKNKPKPLPTFPFSPEIKSVNKGRMRSIPQRSERILDTPELVDDYHLNLLDWGTTNILAIALGNSVYLWNASDESHFELVSTDDDTGPVTSVKWAPDGTRIAVGFHNSEVQLWDASTKRLVTSLGGGHVHGARVGSLAWNNNNILTTGDMDGLIINNDVRRRSHVIGTYRGGHHQEVCGLSWSPSGQLLASGGTDNLLCIWNLSSNHSLHRLSAHTSTVKPLAWCPFQSNLLASGGGVNDGCIKFWNSNTGVCLNSVNTGSPVSCLLWNRHQSELLSSHNNQLILWKYPSMVKLTQLNGHISRVLNMTQSPDGYQVASLGAEESLRFWNLFGTRQVTKQATSTNHKPFASFPQIR